MSYQAAAEPQCKKTEGSVDLVIEPQEKDLGEFTVRRVLPAPERRMVGPFIFFDHMGPAEFPPGQGIQVRPHPHIGIATVTYLFEGEILHRDSLGFVQPIRRGALNLMTAGRGIVHSERTGDDLHETSRLHGIQSWMALPDAEEECEPAFAHYPAADLPELEIDGATVRVIIGEAFGSTSPVKSYSPMLYLECIMLPGSTLTLPDSYSELAAYVVSGSVSIDDRQYASGVMAVGCPGKTLSLRTSEESRVMVIGGEPVGKRHIWWNFVSSSRERIARAKADWSEKRFDDVPGEHEFIPLPE
jgi:redox-sensitive bicupin YhaK (pirin superfamily)